LPGGRLNSPFEVEVSIRFLNSMSATRRGILCVKAQSASASHGVAWVKEATSP